MDWIWDGREEWLQSVWPEQWKNSLPFIEKVKAAGGKVIGHNLKNFNLNTDVTVQNGPPWNKPWPLQPAQITEDKTKSQNNVFESCPPNKWQN